MDRIGVCVCASSPPPSRIKMSSMPIVHLRDFHQRKKIFAKWEKHRHSKEVHWAMECFAEMVRMDSPCCSQLTPHTRWECSSTCMPVSSYADM